MKELTITPPEGYEIDKENSSFERIVFKRKEYPTYGEVAKNLFNGKRIWYPSTYGSIEESVMNSGFDEPNNCTSEKQAHKLLAINMLMNVAKYLNGDWKPNWKIDERKYTILVDPDNLNTNVVMVYGEDRNIGHFVYFKTREAAEQAINILGKDIIRLAFSTDW